MKRTALVGLALLLVCGLAQAAVEQGDTEINLSGSYSRIATGDDNGVKGSNYKIFNILGGYDYFITDRISAGATLGYTDYTQSTYNLNYWSLGLRGRYHFLVENPLVPYVGGEFNYNHGLDIGTRDSDNQNPTSSSGRQTGTSYGPILGARYELSPQSQFFIEYCYLWLQGDWNSWQQLNVDTQQMVRFGIIHQFE